MQAAYVELKAMAGSGVARLKAVMKKQANDEASSVAQAKAATQPKAKAKAASRDLGLFEKLHNCGTEIPSFVYDSVKGFSEKVPPDGLRAPYIARLPDEITEPKLSLSAESVIMKAASAYAQAFAQSKERTNPGRAQRKLVRECSGAPIPPSLSHLGRPSGGPAPTRVRGPGPGVRARVQG